jgi:hypothetical protein
VKLVFYPDYTFKRFGFSSEPEEGVWNIKEKDGILILKSNYSKNGDKLKINKISEDEFIFEVDEKIEKTEVTTRISFKKQK